MHPIDNTSWLVIFSLVEFSMGSINSSTNATYDKLLNLSETAAPKRPLALGGQDFNQCCKLAIYQSLNIDKGHVLGLKNTSYVVNGNLTELLDGQIPCGATYNGM